jgi:hypothetical protein
MSEGFAKKCTYCWKDSDNLEALPASHKDHPNNKYCPKCYPKVYADSFYKLLEYYV